jgi:beta,beta-carotene 9',10'-dioxygenase
MATRVRIQATVIPPGARLRGLGVHSKPREADDAPVEVRGRLPDWLRGDLLLNGPALWDLPNGGYRHWFDGLAMLHRVSLGRGEPRYRSRFLRSQDYLESTAAGRPAFGAFGTPEPGGFWSRMRNLRRRRTTDNGAVVLSRLGTRWVAVTETPRLTGFDPQSLETTGPIELAGEAPLDLMSAHGTTEADGTWWNAGIRFGRTCTYEVFSVPPGSLQRRVLARIPVARPGYLHAVALTPRQVVLWEPAWRAQPMQFLLGGQAYMDKFRWEPEGGSRIHCVARDTGSVQTWDVPPLMAFHAVQAWEDDGATVLELCVAASADIVPALGLEALRAGRSPGVPYGVQVLRYRLAPGRARVEPEPVVAGAELPVVHGSCFTRRRARFAWSAGFDPEGRAPLFDRTLKLDLVAGSVAGTWQRPGAVQLEPLMVDRPGSTDEEDGVLLVPTLADADPGTVVGVLDPASMACLATLHLPRVVPFGFHAAWNAAG